MADTDLTPEDDDTAVLDAPELDEAGETPAEASDEGEQADDDADEVAVSIGDEQPEAEEARAPEWVRELRRTNRELRSKLRERETEVERLRVPAPAITLGERPKLADFDFDEDKHAAAVDAWNERKLTVRAQQAEQQRQQQAHQDAWQAKLAAHAKAKTALKVPDYDEAEASVLDTLSVIQQGVIVNGADNSALLVYALGKNPAKAKELAAITDPVKFAFAVAKLETQLKVTPRKSAPAPERAVRSNVAGAAGAMGTERKLEALRQKAHETGDMNAYLEAKRKLKANAR